MGLFLSVLGCGSPDPHQCCPSVQLHLDWCEEQLDTYKANPDCHETVHVVSGNRSRPIDCPAGTVAEITASAPSAQSSGFNSGAKAEAAFAIRCKCP